MGWFSRRKATDEATSVEKRLAKFAEYVAECSPYELRTLAAATDTEWNLFLTLFGSVAAFQDAPRDEQQAHLNKRLVWQADLQSSGAGAEGLACELVNHFMAAAIAGDQKNREAAIAIIFHLIRSNGKKAGPDE